MNDSSLHGGRPADSSPPGELAGRLLRRAHGGGVIDAGWAQRRFAYTTDWIAERFAVLGLLNARYGTVDNPGTRTSTLPIVHGSFARSRPGKPPNESTPGMTAAEASPRTTANIDNTPIASIVQRKSATLPPDAALPRLETRRPESQKSQSTPPQEPQPASARESVYEAGMELSSSHDPPAATAANENVQQPSASNVAPESANTKQSIEVLETVTRPRATGEPTLHVDARAETRPTGAGTAADSILARESSELNTLLPNVVQQDHLMSSPEQQPSQRSQTANPLRLRESAMIISRVARDASDPLAMRDETIERGERESESQVSGAGDSPVSHGRTNSVLPITREQTATGHLSHLNAPLQQRQREPAQTAAEHRSPHDQSTVDAAIASSTVQADGVRAHPPVRAPEVFQRSSVLSGARMIWRKGFSGASDSVANAPPRMPRSYSAQSVSSWETLQRAERTAADARATSGDGVSFAPAAATQPQAGGIDLEQITEHVSRVILRRVSVERERRGIGRWL